MPTMANITVKNAANADVVYVAKVPSAGDKTPAVWTFDGAHAIQGFRPKFVLGTRDNGPKNARILEGSLSFPVIATVDSVDVRVATVPISLVATLPTNVDASKVYDAAVQATNLFVATLVRQCFSTGYAPT